MSLCPNCDTEGESNGRKVAFICPNDSCRVEAFYVEPIDSEAAGETVVGP